ncbi:MAG: T9SS type A sorting domain-containing protein, partial [Runella zeae]
SGSDVVCAGSSTQMRFQLDRASALFVNVRVELWNVDKNLDTGISKEEKNICVFPKCSSAVDVAKRNQTWSFEIPQNLEPGNYSFKMTVYQGDTIKATDPSCNTRAFKVIKPELIVGRDVSPFGEVIKVINFTGCKSDTYRWSNAEKTSTIYVCPTETTSYTLSCETICGTTITSNAILVEAIKQYPDIQGPIAFCAGNSISLKSQYSGAYGPQWYKDGTAIQNRVTEIDVSEGGSYQVGSSSFCPEQTKSNPFIVQKSEIRVDKISGGFEYCAGSSLTLSSQVSGGIGSYKYEWLRNGEKVGESNNLQVSIPGNYRVSVTDGIGCKASFLTNVPIIENPRPVFRLPPLRNLTGTETELVQAIPVSYTTGPYSYNWTTEPNVNTSVTNDGYDAPTFGPFTQNTTIKLRVTDAKGCESEEVRTLLTYTPCTLSAGIQSQSFFFCKGSLPLVSTVQNGNGDYSYQWQKNNNPIGSSTSTLDVTEGGQYSVVITDRKGCRSTSGTVSVTKGNPTVQITGKLEFCAGGSTLLKTTTQNAKFPISYRWANGTNSDSLRVAAAGSYTVDITDAQGCSATSAVVAVVQNPLPIASAGLGKSVTCAETYALTGVSTASGGAGNYQYAWSSSPAVAIQGATSAQPTLGPFIENTTVSVRVTDAKGCVGTAQSNVTYIPPDLNVSLIGASEFCSGKSVPLKAIIEKANLPLKQLVWYNGTQEVKRSVNDSPTAPIEWTTNQKGSYTVFVEDNKGCRKTSAVLNVVENPTPNVRIQGSSFFCYGNTTTLIGEINGGTLPFKHQWKLNGIDTGNDSPNLTTDREGRYEMLLIDAKGCSAEAPAFNLVEKGGEIIADVVAQGALSVFAPEKVLLSAAIGNEYQYQWVRDKTKIQGATAATFLAEQSGNYTVTVSRKECSRTSSAVTVKIETPTSVTNTQTLQWLIWPNPIQNVLNIRAINQVGGVFQVWIVDGSGRVIDERQFTNQKEVSISSQDWGIGKYTLKIVTASSQVSASILKAN